MCSKWAKIKYYLNLLEDLSTDHSKIRLNFHIYPSYFTNESRILRESQAIVQLGISERVALIGFWKDGLLEREEISDKITLYRLKTLVRKKGNSRWSNVFALFFFFTKLFRLSLRLKPEVINVHSLTLLPFGALLKLIRRSRLIYDAHELETETHASTGLRKRIAQLLERFFIRFADHTIVVSHSIETWYTNTYNLKKITTIKNIPEAIAVTGIRNTKSILGIDETDQLYIYVGLLSGGRGIELLLNAFKNLQDSSKHLLFLGYGDLEAKVKSSLTSNIHYLSAVPPKEVLEYVAGADVGLSIIENSCLSYYYSLPNKVFEYMTAGIPFVCSNFPDVHREFGQYDVCWFADSESNLQSLLAHINKEDISIKKENVMRQRGLWNWETEKMKLKEVYGHLSTVK